MQKEVLPTHFIQLSINLSFFNKDKSANALQLDMSSTETLTHIHREMFIAALSIVAKKLEIYLSINIWIGKWIVKWSQKATLHNREN